jgi:hypothetical protein
LHSKKLHSKKIAFKKNCIQKKLHSKKIAFKKNCKKKINFEFLKKNKKIKKIEMLFEN